MRTPANKLSQHAMARNGCSLQNHRHPLPKSSFLHVIVDDPPLHSIDVNSMCSPFVTKLSKIAHQNHIKSYSPPLPPQDSSASSSAKCKSPIRDNWDGFVIWNNAVFCSDSCDWTSCNTGSSLRSPRADSSSERDKNYGEQSEPARKDEVLDFIALKCTPSVASKCDRYSLSTTASAMAGSSPPALSERSIGEDDQHPDCDLSADPALRVHDWLRPSQGITREESWTKRSVGDSLHCGRKINDSEYKNSQTDKARHTCRPSLSKCAIQSFPNFSTSGLELDTESSWLADDEARVRAELEVEIEKDLEREIKRKISLLSRRLGELHALQAHRYSKLEQKNIKQEKAGYLDKVWLPKSSSKAQDIAKAQAKEGLTKLLETQKKIPVAGLHKEDKQVNENLSSPEADNTAPGERKETLPKLLETGKRTPIPEFQKHKTPLQAGKILTALSDGKPSVKKGVHFSYASTPVTRWKRMGTAPTLSHSGLGVDSQMENLTHNSIKITKTPKSSQVLTNSMTNVKPKPAQRWTSVANAERFDWVKTLRSGVSSSPRVSTSKLHHVKDLSSTCSAVLSSINGTRPTRVARTLFLRDGLSAPSKGASSARTSSKASSENLKHDKKPVFDGLSAPSKGAGTARTSSQASTENLTHDKKPVLDGLSAPSTDAGTARASSQASSENLRRHKKPVLDGLSAMSKDASTARTRLSSKASSDNLQYDKKPVLAASSSCTFARHAGQKTPGAAQKSSRDPGIALKRANRMYSKKDNSRRNCIRESRVYTQHAFSKLAIHNERGLHDSKDKMHKCIS